MWNQSAIKIDLILLRHGMTKGNEEHRYIGRTDEELSEKGILQLREHRVAEIRNSQLVFVSPRKRCQQSAQILFPGMKQIIIPEWAEMDFGDFEGKNYEELKDQPDYQKWIDSHGTRPFPNGGCQKDFVSRCVRGMEAACQIMIGEIPKEQQILKIQVAAVVHGGTIMALMHSICGGDYYDYQAKNGHGYRLCDLLLCELSSKPTLTWRKEWKKV